MSDNREINESREQMTRQKKGRRGKRKADVVRPGPLYHMVDALVTIAGLALVGAIVVFVIMTFA